MKECLNYRKINDTEVECFTCNHKCRIKDGRLGICGVRQNIKGKLYSLVYERAIAVNVDPIEKKPLFHFLPGSLAYSFGTLGCNFRCENCQNYDISQIFGIKGNLGRYEDFMWGSLLTPEDIVKQAKKSGCQSIAYTYTEPTIFLEYALDTMKLARKEGLKNIWVSNGYMSEETLQLIIPYLDAVNIDIKSFNNDFYTKKCGGHLQPVLENCKRIVKEKIWLETTTLIVPGLSDDEKKLWQIAEFIKNELGDFVPWHVSAFSARISWKLKHLPDTSWEKIEKAYRIGKEAGLKYVYAGNVLGEEMENTYCHHCNELVFSREGFLVSRFDKDGKCNKCGNQIEGVF